MPSGYPPLPARLAWCANLEPTSTGVSGEACFWFNVPLDSGHGGTVSNTLKVTVTDRRIGRDRWYVMTSVSPFSTSEDPPSSFPATIEFVSEPNSPLAEIYRYFSALQSDGTTGPGAPTILMSGNLVSQPTGSGTSNFSSDVPGGIAPGIYRFTLTLDVYAGDPP